MAASFKFNPFAAAAALLLLGALTLGWSLERGGRGGGVCPDSGACSMAHHSSAVHAHCAK